MKKLSSYLQIFRSHLYHQLLTDELFKLLSLYQLFVPTNKTKGQLGERNILSILFMPMLLYFAASLAVSVILRWMGTVRMLSMEKSPFVVFM